MRRQDWIIVAGILFLAAFMPMAIGGTWGVAYIVGETIVCLMLLVWAGEMRRAPAFPARAAVSKIRAADRRAGGLRTRSTGAAAATGAAGCFSQGVPAVRTSLPGLACAIVHTRTLTRWYLRPR